MCVNKLSIKVICYNNTEEKYYWFTHFSPQLKYNKDYWLVVKPFQNTPAPLGLYGCNDDDENPKEKSIIVALKVIEMNRYAWDLNFSLFFTVAATNIDDDIMIFFGSFKKEKKTLLLFHNAKFFVIVVVVLLQITGYASSHEN